MTDKQAGDRNGILEAFVEALLDNDFDRSILDGYCERHPDLRETLEEKYEVVTAVDGAFREDGLVGTTIGDFLICEELGRGGMGIVYLALQQSLDRYVALKVLPAPFAGGSESINNMQREARIVARFNHPNIVPIFSSGSEKGIYYIAMAYVPGLPLSAVLEGLRSLPGERVTPASVRDMLLGHHDMAPMKRMDEAAGHQGSIMVARDPSFWERSYADFVFALCAEIADALSYAHKNGVCHGDLKPSNIMLTSGGTPMLVDFGLARDVGSMVSVQSKDFLGTLAYASPEHLSGGSRSEASDIWSLGVTIYEMLTLRQPFRTDDVAGTLDRIARKEPPSVQSLKTGTSRDAGAVVARCMEKEPRRRYGNAGRLKEDIDNILSGRPVAARTVGQAGRLVRWSRRNRSISLLALFLLLSSATAGYALFGFTVRSIVVEGTGYMDNGNYAEALRAYERAMVLLEWLPFSTAHRSEVTSAMGNAWSGKGDYDKAIHFFEAALRLDPDCVSALMGLGDVYFEKEAHDKTIALYDRVLSLSPGDRLAYFQRAKAYREKGLYDDALRDFHSALRIAPDDRESAREIAAALGKKGLATEKSRAGALRTLGFDDQEIESVLRSGRKR